MDMERKGKFNMYDRFLVLLNDNIVCYTKSFNFLCSDIVKEVLKHERTFDNGTTWKEV